MASGKAAWTLSLARGETLRLGHLEADAFYCVCARAGQTTLRRLDARTGKVAWTRVFERQEEVVDWEPACAALCLGITESRDRTRRAKVLALDKPTNEVRQEVDVGPGALASLRRIGRALYAVVEAEPGPFAARRVPAFGHVRAMEPRFRVVRLLGSRSAKE